MGTLFKRKATLQVGESRRTTIDRILEDDHSLLKKENWAQQQTGSQNSVSLSHHHPVTIQELCPSVHISYGLTMYAVFNPSSASNKLGAISLNTDSIPRLKPCEVNRLSEFSATTKTILSRFDSDISACMSQNHHLLWGRTSWLRQNPIPPQTEEAEIQTEEETPGAESEAAQVSLLKQEQASTHYKRFKRRSAATLAPRKNGSITRIHWKTGRPLQCFQGKMNGSRQQKFWCLQPFFSASKGFLSENWAQGAVPSDQQPQKDDHKIGSSDGCDSFPFFHEDVASWGGVCSGLTALPTNRCSPSCMNCFFYFLLLIIVASDCCRSSPSLLFIYNNSSYLCILSYLYHITHSQVMGPVSFRPYMATINSFCQSDGCKARVFKGAGTPPTRHAHAKPIKVAMED